MRAAHVALALCLSSCVQYPDGRFSCSSDGECPGSLRCAADQRCHVDPSQVDASLDANTNDALLDAGLDAPTDTAAPTDAPLDMSSDANTSGSYTLATLIDPSATGHPANNAHVSVSGALVALTPRLLLSSGTHCNFAIWVGDTRGGPHTGIELFDSYFPQAPDGGGSDGGPIDCLTAPANVIPDTVQIGETITAVSGTYSVFCPTGATCPSEVAQEINVSTGVVTVGSMGAIPASMTIALTDIAGDATASTTDYQYQGALVRLSNVYLQQPPNAGNFQTMVVGTDASGGTSMPVVVNHFAASSCVGAALRAMATGASLGNVTGILTYSAFAPGQWTIQLRQASDIPSVTGC